ncbi:MAG TPA: hypothetical protein VFV02_09385, partial [Acidimicrobiales bacterium]|nr:hypothetical protein [Acidimicrobiales bacterium]
ERAAGDLAKMWVDAFPGSPTRYPAFETALKAYRPRPRSEPIDTEADIFAKTIDMLETLHRSSI